MGFRHPVPPVMVPFDVLRGVSPNGRPPFSQASLSHHQLDHAGNTLQRWGQNPSKKDKEKNKEREMKKNHEREMIHTLIIINWIMWALQCVVVCCSVLQCVAVCCNELHCHQLSHAGARRCRTRIRLWQFPLKMTHPRNSPNRQTQISRCLAVQIQIEILIEFEFVQKNLSFVIRRISGVQRFQLIVS